MWDELAKFLTGGKEIPQLIDGNLSFDLSKGMEDFTSPSGSIGDALGQAVPNEFAPGGPATAWGKLYSAQLGAMLRPDGLPLGAVELEGKEGDDEEEKEKKVPPPALPPFSGFRSEVQAPSITQPKPPELSWGPLTFNVGQPGTFDEIARRIMSFK